MKMDDDIKKITNLESIEIPQGYEERIDQLLEKLPEQTTHNPNRKTGFKILKMAAMIVLTIIVSTGTVVAGVILINLGRGKLDISQGTKKFQKMVNLKEIKKNNGQVNVSTKCKDIVFKVDNIGIDQGNLIIYYTIQTKTKRRLPGEAWESTRSRLNQIFSNGLITIDGEEYENMPVSNEIYQVNSKKVRGVFRQSISRHLKQRVTVDLEIKNIWDINGTWDIHLLVNREGITDESIRKNHHQNVIESTVLSPLGNILEIKNGYKNRQFVLQDEKGRYLFYKVDSLGENLNSYCNFFADAKKLKSLKLTPTKDVETKDQFVSLKLTKNEVVSISNHTKLQIHHVVKRKHRVRVYLNPLSYDGADYTDGKENEFLKGSHINQENIELDDWIDYENNLIVLEFHDRKQTSDFRTASELTFVKQQVKLQKDKTETVQCR
ncbi:MAG: DUF4179 domain-containing protein [Anaerostipes sp.]|nr:DUF4179 domain-containing protein [Anaerostipes sp.]